MIRAIQMLAAGAAIVGAAVPRVDVAAPETAAPPVEVVTYMTRTAGAPDGPIEERVRMTIGQVSNDVVTVYTSQRADGCETATIVMGTNGMLVAAENAFVDNEGTTRSAARIWTAGGTVFSSRSRSGGRERLRSRATHGQDVVADAGLLVRLRLFPFDTAKRLDVLMASFDQHFIAMHLRLAGTETIPTVLGELVCHRIEGTIDLVIKEFRMTYWVSVEPPHRLIRYEGKRGLFLSPVFVTEIESLELHAPGTAPDLLPRERPAPPSDTP